MTNKNGKEKTARGESGGAALRRAAPALLLLLLAFAAPNPVASDEGGGRRQAAPAGLPPGAFQDCFVCPWMVQIPAGRFMMGAPESEPYRRSEEGPAHEVTIPRAFAVGVYEVTRAEFGEFAAEEYPAWRGASTGRYPSGGIPHSLSERDLGLMSASNRREHGATAQKYARWLSGKAGKRYRLLSEAEWEYAARAGTTTRYGFGDDISPSDASYGAVRYHSRSQGLQPVGSYAPNAFGLYDMHGGLAEWVRDCWHDSYAGAPTDGSAWEEADCVRRVVRGGSLLDTPMELRSAARRGLFSGFRNFYGYHSVGFRVARDLDP